MALGKNWVLWAGWGGEGELAGAFEPAPLPPVGIYRYNLVARSWKPKKDLSVQFREGSANRLGPGMGGGA